MARNPKAPVTRHTANRQTDNFGLPDRPLESLDTVSITKRPFVCLAFLLSASLLPSGCGDDYKMELAPVSGTLTCNGKPVSNARITFNPQPKDTTSSGNPGRAATDITDEQGRFTLTTYDTGDGAIVGEHKVQITFPPKRNERGAIIGPGGGRSFSCRGKVVTKTVKPGENTIEVAL